MVQSVTTDRSKPFLSLPWVLQMSMMAVFTALCFMSVSGEKPAAFVLTATVQSSVIGRAQLFYDIGRGFSERDSVLVAITEVQTPLTLHFPLPPGVYRALRFDPIDKPGSVTLSAMDISDLQGNLIQSIAPQQLLAVQQVKPLLVTGDGVQVTTGDGAGDPILAITLPYPFVLQTPLSGVLAEQWIVLLASFFLYGGGLWLAEYAYFHHQAQISAAWMRARNWTACHPQRVIAGVAALATLINCYPIVFCEKSFVSPNNHTHLLYDTFPTLPGYDDLTLEDPKGADVGAVMWAHVPYSVIESRALFYDYELPLWNRYNSTGETLLGQGQSMLGDPLHLFVLLAGGASWAWDVKYVLAKVLFAGGLGLTVYAVTAHLPAALLVAFASPFIGFFSFRFNHPAFFSMCYAPWILYCWVRISQNESPSKDIVWLSGLIVANWLEMSSGTVKEAYMLIVSLNCGGLLFLLLTEENWHRKQKKFFQLLKAGGLFVLISAPLWAPFLEALAQAWTAYDDPGAWQIQPGLLIGLFDDLFYRQLNTNELVFEPSANFLVLLGVLWSLARLRELLFNRSYVALGLGAVLPFCLAFGAVPESLINQVPFLANVRHVSNTFSCALIIYLIVLAGFGLQQGWERRTEKDWIVDWVIVALLLGALLALYFGTTQARQRSSIPLLPLGHAVVKSHFFYFYAFSLVCALLALPILFRQFMASHVKTLSSALLLGSMLGLLLWRHGMYHSRGAVHMYVLNPQVRANLQAESPAVTFIKANSAQPFRVVGFENTLMPGYSPVLGLEGPGGPDAVRSLYTHEFISASSLDVVWAWRLVVHQETVARLQRIYDCLNIKYYLAPREASPKEVTGLRLVGRFDLDVYTSDSVWPRAFFTDTVTTYDTVKEFVDFLETADGRPFAAVRKTALQDNSALARSVNDAALRHVVAARDYRLTTNTTTFTIDAPQAGVVVLGEAYLSEDFAATVNGQTVPYFRVNHASKGISVDGPGTYTITYSYWPRYLTLSLWSWGVGTVVLTLWLGLAWRRQEGAVKKLESQQVEFASAGRRTASH